jgi:hypothetical protein
MQATSEMRQQQILGLLVVLLVTALSSGCSISKAITQPSKKDLTVLLPGNQRAQVIAELGQPSHQETIAGTQRDVYSFKQGYTKPVKIARAVGHGFGLVATVGLWELAGYPIELALDGEDVNVMVDYDPDQAIAEVTYFRGGHLRENGPTLPSQLYGGPATTDEEIVRLTRGPTGQTLVAYGSPPPVKRDETRIASSDSQAPEEVNEATYYSSSERGTIRASQVSDTKLR